MSMNISGLGNTYNGINTNSKQYKNNMKNYQSRWKLRFKKSRRHE